MSTPPTTTARIVGRCSTRDIAPPVASTGSRVDGWRNGVALELGVVVTQALAAVWFYRLFRTADAVAAGSIGAFGFVNSVAIMASVAMGDACHGRGDLGRSDRRRRTDRPDPLSGQR
ncbi:DUF4386 family protein [Solwaraspora sp. WMMB335]|uniref:DUF4386 family protein n=1 Tax=Solwaraspora sp. WMMB335 TaxID=3404118 RepID=UPI003B935D14